MYLKGFNHHHSSEAEPGALPLTQNSPQHASFGLYAEQISGSAFTRARHQNLHSWVYRTQPSVSINDFVKHPYTIIHPIDPCPSPNPMRWLPLDPLQEQLNFIEGLFHFSSNASAHAYLYQCKESMHNLFFSSRDGDLLFIPYEGILQLKTEFGELTLSPGSIAVIPRGIYFSVVLISEQASGYLCENKGLPFILPELGVIGANGLANPRHFEYPTAKYETIDTTVTLYCKYKDQLWSSEKNRTPLNVMAWQGNYAPYRYDLSLFNPLNTVSFDHPDPSIFTVLTSPSAIYGVPALDFVIFPERWMVAEHTFRPPYFHRNIMSEWMGLIWGGYDAKNNGFLPGGSSIHNSFAAHGPDAETTKNALASTLSPQKQTHTLAFMLESNEPWCLTAQAMQHKKIDKTYTSCWSEF